MKAIEIGCRVEISEGETRIRDVADRLNKIIDVPGVPEVFETLILNRGLDAASVVTQENLPMLVDAANELVSRFDVPAVDFYVRGVE